MAQLLQLTDIRDIAGLTISASVTDARGRVLVAAGAALTPSLLAALMRHGVVQVSVDGAEAAVPADAPDVERIRRRLEHLFRGSTTSTAGTLLMQRMLAYRTKQPS
jgi:hypothetical protein